jgi:hypothetical protein
MFAAHAKNFFATHAVSSYLQQVNVPVAQLARGLNCIWHLPVVEGRLARHV